MGDATRPRLELAVVLRDAIMLSAVSVMVGLLINLVHPNAIPYVATTEYETVVPCPVAGGEVTAIEADDPSLQDDTTLFVDARTSEEYQRIHYRDAVNVTYDYLEPTPEQTLKELARKLTSSKAHRVVVYGDGDEPDTGEQLGKEISGFGVKNVYFVRGGAPALVGTQRQ